MYIQEATREVPCTMDRMLFISSRKILHVKQIGDVCWVTISASDHPRGPSKRDRLLSDSSEGGNDELVFIVATLHLPDRPIHLCVK